MAFYYCGLEKSEWCKGSTDFNGLCHFGDSCGHSISKKEKDMKLAYFWATLPTIEGFETRIFEVACGDSEWLDIMDTLGYEVERIPETEVDDAVKIYGKPVRVR